MSTQTERPPELVNGQRAEHIAALSGIRLKRDRVRYACEQMPPGFKRDAVTDWLQDLGFEVGSTVAHTEIADWRKGRGIADTGSIPKMDEATLAAMDARHAPKPPASTQRDGGWVEDEELATLARPTEHVRPQVEQSEPVRPVTPNAPVRQAERPPGPRPVVTERPAEHRTERPDRTPATEPDGAYGRTVGKLRASASRAIARGPVGLLAAFYGVTASIALWGQSDGLQTLLGLTGSDLPGWAQRGVAVGAGLVVELLAAVLLAFADWRMIHKGERAASVRAFAVVVAAFVVYLNWTGHGGSNARIFFAGISAVGFVVWLLHSSARRRDALRAAGRLAAAPPAYPLLMWVRHFPTTWKAREVTKRDRSLSLYGSIEHVRSEEKAAARRADLETLIGDWLSERYQAEEGDTPEGRRRAALRVAIESARYDLDTIARGLSGSADHTALTDAIASELAIATRPNTQTEQ